MSDDGSHVGDPTPPRTEEGYTVEEGNASEWVLLEVEGMSFLLHQIRKMVATVADLSRRAVPPVVRDESVGNSTPGSAVTTASTPAPTALASVLGLAFGAGKVNTPMAPALGLYLDSPSFTQYNKWARISLHDCLFSR